jgi:hypothetical protein
MDPAEPRREAQKTDLEVFMRVRGPELLRQHASNIILGVLILLAVAMFLYTRSRNKVAFEQANTQNTAVAYDYAMQARSLLETPGSAPQEIQERVKQATNAADMVLESDAPPLQKAAAQLAKAEVFWALANAPERSLASTQPVIGFTVKTPDAYLADADAAYTEILSKYADQKDAVGNALLGLAAIAENRRDFVKAGDWYNRAAADDSLRPEYRLIAKSRLAMLDQLQKPYALAAPATQQAAGTTTAQPTTQQIIPAFALPTSAPAAPATAAPTMAPAAAPTTAPAAAPTTTP